jgi:hypothetical protein
MSDGHFLSVSEVERFFQHKPRHLLDIALELRNLVASIAPGATERILWKGLSYHDEQKGGPVKGGICQIEIHKDHVRLSFIHGAFLKDPESMLEGDRRYKRFVKIKSYETAPWEYLRELIQSSVGLDPHKIAPAL